eukprot:bmy_18231T0
MRVKEPSKALPEKAKRSRRPTIPHDEDSSDDIAGFTCQHKENSMMDSQYFLLIFGCASSVVFRCYECDEKLSTHCNKKVLAQIVDFLQKHVSKTQTSKLTAVAKEICIKV